VLLQAYQSCSDDWSDTKLISCDPRKFAGKIPRGFETNHITCETGSDEDRKGWIYVNEHNLIQNRDFALDVLLSIIDPEGDPIRMRRKTKSSLQDENKKLATFKAEWNRYDWTAYIDDLNI
jgi:hypothetical protein